MEGEEFGTYLLRIVVQVSGLEQTQYFDISPLFGSIPIYQRWIQLWKKFRNRHHAGTCNCTCRQLPFLDGFCCKQQLLRRVWARLGGGAAKEQQLCWFRPCYPAVPNPDKQCIYCCCHFRRDSYPWISMTQLGRALKQTRYEIKWCFVRFPFVSAPFWILPFHFQRNSFIQIKDPSQLNLHIVSILTTSAAKDGGSWVWFAGLKQQINITTAKAGACWFIGSPDRAPAVPNPKNASFAAIVSTEILPMILNETAGKIIKNGVHVVRHHQMFCSNPFFYTRHEVHVRRILLILSC